MNKNSNLPKLDYLLAYEAVAESESITNAAGVLNISESAVSRKVRLLEDHYDRVFFIRQKQSIRLSQDGREFLENIRPILQQLRELSNGMIGKNSHKSVQISATNSVASLWLLPKLRKFLLENPEVNISIQSTDDDVASLSSNSDLIILRGNGEWAGFDAGLLFGETIFPVCAPSFLDESPISNTLSAVKSLPLIEVASTHKEWMNWEAWLKHMGVESGPLEHITSFNTYPLSIQAAQNGFGLALGWAHLVDEDLKNGSLVRPFGNAAIRTNSGYYLLSRKDTKTTPWQKTISNFLKSESAQRTKFLIDENVVEVV